VSSDLHYQRPTVGAISAASLNYRMGKRAEVFILIRLAKGY
jgi:hypothetical protein